MKFTAFILLAFCLQVSATTLAQNVTLSEHKAPLEKVINEIKHQTGYSFFYNQDWLQQAQPVDVQVKNAPLEQVLKTCFANQPFDYAIVNKTIVLKLKEKPAEKKEAALAPITVSGKVQDETGQPMVGVTVKIKDTQQATATDRNGTYSITVPDNNTVIVFSFIGFETQELRAKDIAQGSVIVLKATSTNLHEVLINKGYYLERQELSTGSTARITAKEIDQQPVSNLLIALQGRIPGLVIDQTAGLPGSSFSVQIRGQNSFLSGTNPFIVIDGVPYNSDIKIANGIGQNDNGGSLINSTLNGGNPLNFINPHDIESIEVLKDADATSIYGSRAANGAILITTKRGKAGTMKLDVRANSGFTSPTRDIQLLNTQQWLNMRHQAFKNDGVTPDPVYDFDVNGIWDTTRYTNWSKVLTKNMAHYNNVQLSISGGTTNTQYLVSGGYNHQTTGMPVRIPNDGADNSGSVHFNLNTQSSDQKFRMSFTGSYVSNKNTINSEDLSQYRFLLPPDAPELINPDGSVNFAPANPGEAGTFYNNPSAYLFTGTVGLTNNLLSNAVLSYQLLPGLQIKTNLGYSNTQTNETQTTPTTQFDPAYKITSGSSVFSAINSQSWIVEPQVNYKVNIGHGVLEALVGTSFNSSKQSNKYQNATGFLSDALLGNLSAASSVTNSGNAVQYKYNAIYGRLNYNLQDKYIVNVTARRDGSSRFGPGKQFGNFGSIGAGWIFSKEQIIANNLSFLSFGKIRLSYGTTGNDQIGDYEFLNLYSVLADPYSGTKGIYPSTLFNPNLSWEVDKKLNVGVELGFLKDRINLQVDYYRNRSGNQLVSDGISLITGFSAVPQNLPALVQNTGLEISLNTISIKAKNFTWSTNINFTIPKNKLVDFPGLATSAYASVKEIGQPISSFPVFHFVDVNPTTGIYEFLARDGTITSSPNSAKDKIDRIDLTKKFYGGFQNTITYKNFSIDFLFQFTKQNGRNIVGNAFNTPGSPYFNIPLEMYSNTWAEPGDISKYQKFTQGFGAPYTAFNAVSQSNYGYSDASFVRLKNMAVSWQLRENQSRKLHLKNARLFIEGQNLFTISNYFGIDPETQSVGSPPRRVWTAGLEVAL